MVRRARSLAGSALGLATRVARTRRPGANGARARKVAGRLHAGTVNVNEAFTAAWGSIDAPTGGMGHSGLGRRHGAEGLLKYTEAQTVAHQRLQGFTPRPAGPSTSSGRGS